MAPPLGFGGSEYRIQWLLNARIIIIELYFYETEFLLQALDNKFLISRMAVSNIPEYSNLQLYRNSNTINKSH